MWPRLNSSQRQSRPPNQASSDTERAPHPWTKLTAQMLPFADAASPALSLPKLLRLSLFQVAVGMASVMLLGTLNRVLIVELGLAAWLVAIMVALPVLIAPFRAFLGFRSDNRRSAVGWKRVPYLWFGTLWQMGGLAVMPFALIVLSGDQAIGPDWAGEVLAALAFLMTGLGLHMTQTAGLALASDLSQEANRPRVVALLYVMFLLGMVVSAVIIGWLLADFSKLRLIQVLQGTALATMGLNLIALWKQERMQPMSRAERAAPSPHFRATWRAFASDGQVSRLLFVVFIGTLGFSMQDILLEPYGGDVLDLSVSATTLLTASWAIGALIGFALAARWLKAAIATYRIAARGVVLGVAAFACVILSAPLGSPALFFVGSFIIGLGSGLFAVAMLMSAMQIPVASVTDKSVLGEGAALESNYGRGLALGAWGAAQASAAGLGIAFGGALKEGAELVVQQIFAQSMPASFGYTVVYHTEIVLLFITLIALGPLIRVAHQAPPITANTRQIGLSEFPT